MFIITEVWEEVQKLLSIVPDFLNKDITLHNVSGYGFHIESITITEHVEITGQPTIKVSLKEE